MPHVLRAFSSALILCLFIVSSTVVFAPDALSSHNEASIVVPTTYPTIQAAIDSANVGDTILVLPGLYRETLTITKTLKLIGSSADSTIIEGDSIRHTVLVESVSNVVFSNFLVRTAPNSSTSGVYIKRGVKNVIENVSVTGHLYGIHIYDSGNNRLRNNNMTGNKYNLRVWGLYLSHFLHDIDFTNLVDGRPVCYWVSQQSMTVPQNAGYVALVNCTDIIVQNLSLSDNSAGVLFAYTNNSVISGVSVSENENGLYLLCSHNNLVMNNNVSNNYWNGILTISATGNYIIANVLDSNTWQGIRLSHAGYLLSKYSENNFILGNNISRSYNGVYFEDSNNNVANGNIVESSRQYAIVLDKSDRNILCRNTIRYNKWGIRVDRSNNNTLHSNILLNNTSQLSFYDYSISKNTWDDGYPSGGNYWSDYTGVDLYSGPNQDQPGSDGIGDNFYIIDVDNQDRYPLVEPPSASESPKAQFTYEPWEPRVNESVFFSVSFIASNSNIVLSIWNIADVHYVQDHNVTFTFLEEGTYPITLVIFDDEGRADIVVADVPVRKVYTYLVFSTSDEAFLDEDFAVSVVLQDEDGVFLASSMVSFYLVNGSFHELIGSCFTNSSGVATTHYAPSDVGDLKVWAVFEGDQWHYGAGKLQDMFVRARNPGVLWMLVGVFLVVSVALWIVRLLKSKGRLLSARKNK